MAPGGHWITSQEPSTESNCAKWIETKGKKTRFVPLFELVFQLASSSGRRLAFLAAASLLRLSSLAHSVKLMAIVCRPSTQRAKPLRRPGPGAFASLPAAPRQPSFGRAPAGAPNTQAAGARPNGRRLAAPMGRAKLFGPFSADGNYRASSIASQTRRHQDWGQATHHQAQKWSTRRRPPTNRVYMTPA